MSIFKIMKLILGVGFPPDIKDEEAFRAWMVGMTDAASSLAMLTGNEMDNRVAGVLETIVDSDSYWAVLYSVLLTASEYITLNDQKTAAAGEDGISTLCQQAAIDPATLITIINAILSLIDWWRNRK